MNAETLPFYDDLTKRAQHALKKHVTRHVFEAGAILTADETRLCESLYFVKSGLIRVYRMNEAGREVTLYHVSQDMICMKNLSCMLRKSDYDAHAIAVEPSDIVAVPKDVVVETLMKESAFIDFMMRSTFDKIDMLMKHYEAMSFAPIRTRLMMYLSQRSSDSKRILYVSQSDIAKEIGASREAVSRQLAVLEKEGYVKRSRGKIKILTPL